MIAEFSYSIQGIPLDKQVKFFRRAIMDVDPNEFQFGLLAQFPEGCCEITSYLLAKFLHEEVGTSGIVMVSGENKYKNSQRHIWLRCGTIDIDITANQFPSCDKAVIVEESSEWHQRYSIFEKKEPIISFSEFHDECKYDIIRDYDNILGRFKRLYASIY